jgi:Arc/MetJ family transcription regulator
MAIRKTALLLDEDLVEQVKQLLGTSTTTETLAEALREVIRVRGRARHLERLHRREGLDLDDAEAMRGAWRIGGRDLGDPPR